jgi:hypothetical protein
MAYILRGNYTRRADQFGHIQPGGWWKFAAFAIAATITGVLFVSGIWGRSSESSIPTLPQAMIIEVAPPAGSGVLVDPSVATQQAVPRPIAQAPTGNELDTPATVQSQQIEVAPRSDAPVAPPAIVAPAAVAPPAVDPARNASLHSLNLSSLTAVQNLARQLNGSIDSAAVQYADITGDGIDEAVVPITSEGTQGDMGFVVLMQGNGTPQPILVKTAGRDSRGVVVSFDNRQLTSTSAIYGPADPECCPSQIVRTYYRWDGNALVVDHENTISVPKGKLAD